MKTKFLRCTLCALLSAFFVLSCALVSNADGTHGFFMTCYTNVTDKKTDGFMMDFYSDSENALCTYWSNANWSMYTKPTIQKYKYLNFTGGGAYAGLQIGDTPDDRRGIMSMWRYEYMDLQSRETKYIYAKAIYGKTTTYDNEGSGTSCVMPYAWKSNQWYRELLLCWEDEETGNTFIGTWYYDYEADKWTLFAYYNTFLVDSYIQGDIGQFLENFVESTRENYRSFRYRNIYLLPTGQTGIDSWKSCDKIYIQSDANPKAHGEAKLGLSEDGTYVWAWVDGRSEIDTDEKLDLTATLKQDAKPTVGTPAINAIAAKNSVSNGKILSTRINWEMTENSTPQLSYSLKVVDENGNELASASGTRPEVNSVKLDDLKTDSYKCELTVTDVFGQTATATYTSENFGKTSETSEPTGTEAPVTTVSPETTPAEEDDIVSAVIGASAAAIVVIVIVVVVFIVIKKKKNKE